MKFKYFGRVEPLLFYVVCELSNPQPKPLPILFGHVPSSSGDADLRVTSGPKGGCEEGGHWFSVLDLGLRVQGFFVWALMIRRGFGVYFPMIIIRNPQNPVLIIKAPIVGLMAGFWVLCLAYCLRD